MKGQKGDHPVTFIPDDHQEAILGHELGNVLNGLLGMADLLADSGLDAEQRRWLDAIRHSGLQLHSLITSCSRRPGEAGRLLEPRPERTDGVDLLEQVITSHAPASHERMNRLVLLTDPVLPRYWHCDACLVRQLLDNLLGNAIKFTAKGEIVVEASAAGMERGGGTLMLRVADTGPGIDNAVGERLFEPYVGSEHAGGDPTGNRGLGLYICREISRAMGGTISWRPRSGAGALFEVTLPGLLRRSGGVHEPLDSGLLGRVACRLELDGPLRLSVEHFLARLGVRPRGRESARHGERQRNLALTISTPPGPVDTGLQLATMGVPGVKPIIRTLRAPVLESSLGTLLLEMVLEWRSALRNATPD